VAPDLHRLDRPLFTLWKSDLRYNFFIKLSRKSIFCQDQSDPLLQGGRVHLLFFPESCVSSRRILHRNYCPHTLKHNEVAERKKALHNFWDSSSSCAFCLYSSRVLGRGRPNLRLSDSPSFSVLSGISLDPLSSRTPPNHSCLKVFGSTCSILLEMSAPRKSLFSFESWLYEADNHTGSRCYDPPSSQCLSPQSL